MLYTKRGDDGTTKTFACDQRISKSSIIAEALGTLDEINSYLGFCKVLAEREKVSLSNEQLMAEILHDAQENLFIIQAEVAGAEKNIEESKIKEIEQIVDMIEKELPPIKSFFIAGGTELTACLDIARTISRRAERRVVEVSESYFAKASQDKENETKISENALAYLNRLSSLLYALARLSNHFSGIKEESPDYK